MSGTVRDVAVCNDGRYALVEIDPGAACARCEAGKGCGAGLFGNTAGSRRIEALVPPGAAVSAGDRVEIGFAGSDLLAAALLVYGLPIAAAVAAATLASMLSAGDAGMAGAALGGLACGHWLARRRLSRTGCLGRLQPVIRCAAGPSVAVDRG